MVSAMTSRAAKRYLLVDALNLGFSLLCDPCVVVREEVPCILRQRHCKHILFIGAKHCFDA